MLMPMVWTDDFDDVMDDWFDPFDDVVVLEDEPTKDEIATDKSIGRHLRREGRRYDRALRHSWNRMNRMLNQNAMKTDVTEDGDHFTVKADLPGFEKKDIHIGLKDGFLTVTASHEDNNDEKDEKSGKYLRRERSSTSYQRTFEVGEDVKPEEINAQYENGVLTLTVPNKAAAVEKKEEKQIEVH